MDNTQKKKQKEPRIAAPPFLENPHLIPNTGYCDSPVRGLIPCLHCKYTYNLVNWHYFQVEICPSTCPQRPNSLNLCVNLKTISIMKKNMKELLVIVIPPSI